MHEHRHLLYFLKNRELDELYASIALRSFAISMISIFIPIYLLKLDYTLASVFLFYAMSNAVHALFVIPAARIASKKGFKHSMLYSVPLLIAFYILLHTLELYNWPLYLLAVISGANNALFWTGYHVDFSKFSDRKNRGKELGTAKIVSSMAHVAGPLIGGLVLTFIGFKTLFVLVSVLLVASVAPLLLSRDIHEPTDFSIKETFRGQKLGDLLAFMGHGIESGVGKVIWPIFIFFSILNKYSLLGLVSTLSLFFSLVFAFIVGRLSDVHRRKVLKTGSLFNAILWGVRSLVRTSLQVFIVDSFYGMSQTLVNIPFDALCYDKANRSNIVRFIMFREIMIQVGRVLLFISMLFIAELTTSFLFAGGSTLLHLLF